MAPLSSQPSRLVVVLSPAQREALYQLIKEITGYMRSQLEIIVEDGDDDASRCANASKLSEIPTMATAESDVSSNNTDPSILQSQRHTAANTELLALRESALTHFDQWKENILSHVKEISDAKYGDKFLAEQEEQKSEIHEDEAPAQETDTLLDQGDPNGAAQDWAMAVNANKSIYHAIPTMLSTLSLQGRRELVRELLLLLLSIVGVYSAYTRTMMAYLASALELPLSVLSHEEREITKTLVSAPSESEGKTQTNASISSQEEAQKRDQENRASRIVKVGFVSAAGAAVMGVTGGLVAPAILLGLGMFWTKGALVGTLFGAFGGAMTVDIANKYTQEVRDFRFLPLKKKKSDKTDMHARGLRVTIGISGWLVSDEEAHKPWCGLGDDAENFALQYETETLTKFGLFLQGLVSLNRASRDSAKMDSLQRTVYSTLEAALWPVQVFKSATATATDPFALAKTKSEKAGQILADTIVNKVQGERPVTLVGYSLGATVIASCLTRLAERRAFGLVDTVVFIGAPIPADQHHWQTMRSVVAGRTFNAFSQNDYVLAAIHASDQQLSSVAGLQPVEGRIEGLVNICMSDTVKEHLEYPQLVASILRQCGFDGIDEHVQEQSATVSQEEVKPGNSGVGGGQGNTRGLQNEAHAVAEILEIIPVAVKPRSKKTHREISFPSGISRTEEQPVVRKVQSVPVPEKHSRRLSLLNKESMAASSSHKTDISD